MHSELTPNRQPIILAVDDTADTRRMITRLMNAIGYKTIEAETGLEAIEQFQAHPIDMILMDVMMPEMDGFTACEAIRDLPSGKTVPIIMLTSLDDKESIQKAFEVGATDYITKPLQKLITQNRVQRWVRAYRAETNLIDRINILEQVNDVLRSTAYSLEIDQILYDVLRVITHALNMTSGYFVEYNPTKDQSTVHQEYFAIESLPGTKDEDIEGALGKPYTYKNRPHEHQWVRNPNRPSYMVTNVPGNHAIKGAERTYYESFGTQTIIWVAVYTQNDNFEFLEFWDASQLRIFDPYELSFLEEIAAMLSGSIINAELYQALKKSEEQLRAYSQRLEMRNEDLDAYNHTIAHDLKSPLTMIQNYAAIIEEDETENIAEGSIYYLQRIQARVKDMESMIDDLLRLSGLEDTSEAVRPVEALPILTTILKHHETALKAINVRVVEPFPLMIANASWLREVLDNLIGNAVKYMRQDISNPQITLYAIADKENNMVRFCVEDTGIGIKKEDQAQIFGRFNRVSHKDYKGFGLGLAIVQRLVQRMDGKVGVESQFNQGSTFWFELPAAPPKRKTGSLGDH